VMVCIDDHSDRVERLALAASELFDVRVEKDLTLLTIRHYNEQVFKEQTDGKTIVLSQRTPETLQMLMK
jgi:aspartate kinase